MADETKVFNDPIHGNIELHPVLVKIIDTPQFQRLRNIKQLGGAYYVYPGASHNRFEHSIGVAHLAGELLQSLNGKQLNLGIDKRDILCVQIAGLCHDLGHGPFSHMFDIMFIREARPKYKRGKWSHEKASQDMFDHLVKENGLISIMKHHGLEPEVDLPFIKELIDPPQVEMITEWPHHGRPREKAFLYEVVSNTRNKIDVDKWDYFARDCHHLGMQNNFDCHRLIKFARVCNVKDEMMQICYRDKEVFNLYNMFYTRFSLHKRAYQHKVANSVEWMITDAFLKADKHLEIKGKDEMFTLSTAIGDMVAYTKLTDTVFDQILNSSSAEFLEAREILERIIKRKLYVCLGEFSSEETLDDMKDQWKTHLREGKPKDYVVELVKYNYGMRKEDPIKRVRFYTKQNPDEAGPIDKAQVSLLLPVHFEEKKFRIYTKRTNEEDLEADRELFNTFGPAKPRQV